MRKAQALVRKYVPEGVSLVDEVITDEVTWLGNTPSRQALTPQLRLPHYLLGYGSALAGGIKGKLAVNLAGVGCT
ncbi:MAG: hypothetical protein ACUVSD_10545 [Thiobacillaceae bacterium]